MFLWIMRGATAVLLVVIMGLLICTDSLLVASITVLHVPIIIHLFAWWWSELRELELAIWKAR